MPAERADGLEIKSVLQIVCLSIRCAPRRIFLLAYSDAFFCSPRVVSRETTSAAKFHQTLNLRRCAENSKRLCLTKKPRRNYSNSCS